MKKDEIAVGDIVTCVHAREAYYSGYKVLGGRRPVMVFNPGVSGCVGAVDVPKVFITPKKLRTYGQDGKDSFVCVDYLEPATGELERVALDYCNIVKV